MEVLNLENLPDEAKREIIDFYNQLLIRYSKKEKKQIKEDRIQKLEYEIDKLSWNMGEKLYKSREELHER